MAAVNNAPDGGQYFAGVSIDSPAVPVRSLYLVTGDPSLAVQKYNMALDAWTTLRKIPSARSSSVGGVAAAAVGTALPIDIYAVGSGYPPFGTYGIINERYTVATDVWTSRKSMPTGRGVGGAAAKGNSVFVVGGSNPSPRSTLEIYNAATDTWSTGMRSAPRNRTDGACTCAPSRRVGSRFLSVLQRSGCRPLVIAWRLRSLATLCMSPVA